MFDRESAMENQLTQRTGVKPAFQSHSIEYSLAGFKLVLLRIYNTWGQKLSWCKSASAPEPLLWIKWNVEKKWKNWRKII